jgi:hypothetical protein
MVLGAGEGRLGPLFVVTLIAGWLLTFLLGILQRILPFLASMHAARDKRRAPVPSALTAERPLAVHAICHFAALALLVLAIVLQASWLAQAAALAGAAGALAFAVFFAGVLRRMTRSSAGVAAA